MHVWGWGGEDVFYSLKLKIHFYYMEFLLMDSFKGILCVDIEVNCNCLFVCFFKLLLAFTYCEPSSCECLV